MGYNIMIKYYKNRLKFSSVGLSKKKKKYIGDI